MGQTHKKLGMEQQGATASDWQSRADAVPVTPAPKLKGEPAEAKDPSPGASVHSCTASKHDSKASTNKEGI